MKRLGVIILNWNGLELLKQFLPVAVETTISEEADLIVADNGSNDGSTEWISANFPQVKILKFNKNYGFAEGYNKAISSMEYPYTVLLNSDVEVTPGWWKPLLEFLENNPDVGAVQPKIKSFRNKEYFEYAGAAGGFLDKYGYPYCRGRLFDQLEKDEGQYDGEAADICWASGAALAVRTSAYIDAGGLDSNFFAHMEEIDLCCHMLRLGYRVCALPDSQVYHVGGASLQHGDSKKTYLNFRNNLLLLYKNLPLKSRKKKLFIRRLLDTLAFFMFVLKGDLANGKAIIKAHKDFRRMKHNYKNLPVPPEDFTFPGSERNIILERYLLRKKK